MRPIDAEKFDTIAYSQAEMQARGYEDSFDDGVRYLAEQIDAAPTVDAVPVVRCKECKYWNRFTRVTFKDERKGLCEYRDHIIASQEDFFCADGERKDGADDGRVD